MGRSGYLPPLLSKEDLSDPFSREGSFTEPRKKQYLKRGEISFDTGEFLYIISVDMSMTKLSPRSDRNRPYSYVFYFGR